MKHRTILLGSLATMALIVVLSLAGIAHAATVPLGANGTVTGPTLLPNGMVQYQVDFAEGRESGGAHLVIVDGKLVGVRFFDNEDDHLRAYPELAKMRGPHTSGKRVTGDAMQTGKAPAPAGTRDIHQRYVEAWCYVAAEAVSPNCFSELEEYYTYDGTSVTAANYWALINTVYNWWDAGGHWQVYSGPTCTIGGIPAANVLATGLYNFVQEETGDHLYTSIRTRGYGTGYGIASFIVSYDPGVYWASVDSDYHVHTVY